MKSTLLKLRSVLITASLTLPFIFTSSMSNTASKEKPGNLSNGNIRVVVLKGSPYSRGLTYGRTLKKEINEVIGKWKAHLETDYKMNADEFIEEFFKKT